ncbi:hypothetical protein TSUD_148320 [Trifolium subterraneum]|uniref:Uncharacterized protein n=1 Tax=Trifolium subterraneum TaxID=3900 RepID=A0A2Z6MJD1_TRISU|nr:hypothetical protein TSUD_148320 [Trifolium subterraneum]
MASPYFSLNHNLIYVDAIVVHAENKTQDNFIIDVESDNESNEKQSTMIVDVETENEIYNKQNHDFVGVKSLHADKQLQNPIFIDVEDSHGNEQGNPSVVHQANDENQNMVVFDVESDSGDNQEQNRDFSGVGDQREVSQEHNPNYIDVEAMHVTGQQQTNNFIDLDSRGEADEEQGTFASTIFALMHTYHMEFDDQSPVGKLPGCFGRELGDVLESSRLTTRGGTEINYPVYNPPIRHLVARIERTDTFGSSVMSTSFNVPITRKKTFVRGIYKNMDFYDIYTETLTLPWEGFGQFVLEFDNTDVDLIDCSGDRYPCKLDFGGGPDGKFACRINQGWVDLRRIHKLAPGDKVRFSVTEPHHNCEVYVSFFPAIVKT